METQQEAHKVRSGTGNRGLGRKPGVPNKATKTFRETVTKLLEQNADNVSLWLEQVAADDPAKALDLLTKLAEFAAPKLSRVEQSGEVAITTGYHFAIERPTMKEPLVIEHQQNNASAH